MPRTSLSDFSLPNIDQEFEQWPRGVAKRKLLIHKKKSRNICRPNRKKSKRQPRKLQATFTYKRTHSPDYRIQIYEEDSASFQSDCLDRRSRKDQETEIALEKEEEWDGLREACERRELVECMRGWGLGSDGEMGE